MLELLPWVLAGWTSVGLYLAGSGDKEARYGWAFCLSAQFIWIGFGLATGLWGFVASGLLHLVVYGRNWWLKSGHEMPAFPHPHGAR